MFIVYLSIFLMFFFCLFATFPRIAHQWVGRMPVHFELYYVWSPRRVLLIAANFVTAFSRCEYDWEGYYFITKSCSMFFSSIGCDQVLPAH